MIEANKSPFLCRWLARSIEARVRASFACMRIFGREQFADTVATKPTLVVSNHTSIWDPMFLIWMSNRLVPMDGYALMEARSLARRPFLGRAGGFGVDLDSGEDRSVVLRYAANLLDRPGRVVWVFPQGAERPLTVPLQFRPGAAVIAKLAGVEQVAPVAFRYEMAEVEKPYFYVAMGPPVPVEPSVEATTDALGAGVAAQLERIDRFITGAPDAESPETHLQGQPSRLGRLAERALAFATGYSSTRRALPPRRAGE